MQLVSRLINPFFYRCGWAWIYFAIRHRCASRYAITSRFSFSEYPRARHCPPVCSHLPAQPQQGKKMVWGASTMVAGWVGEEGEGPGSSTTSRMVAVELFSLVFMTHCSILLWFLTIRPLTACSLGSHVQVHTLWSQSLPLHLRRLTQQDVSKFDNIANWYWTDLGGGGYVAMTFAWKLQLIFIWGVWNSDQGCTLLLCCCCCCCCDQLVPT